MRKAITCLAVILLLLGCSAPDKSEILGSITLQIEENYAAKYKAWFQACDYTDYSCIGIKVPKVVSEHMRYGLLGYYDGGDTVYVNRTLKGQRLNEVLMHEMIHYLQVQAGGLIVPGPAKEICEAENEAFTQVDKWLVDHGYADLVAGPLWWRPYGHCYQWFDPNWRPYTYSGKGRWFDLIQSSIR